MEHKVRSFGLPESLIDCAEFMCDRYKVSTLFSWQQMLGLLQSLLRGVHVNTHK